MADRTLQQSSLLPWCPLVSCIFFLNFENIWRLKQRQLTVCSLHDGQEEQERVSMKKAQSEERRQGFPEPWKRLQKAGKEEGEIQGTDAGVLQDILKQDAFPPG